MKLTTIFLLIAALQVSARSNAQPISYEGRSVPLWKVFSAIEDQTNFVFFYRAEDLVGVPPVTAHFKKTMLTNVLDDILKGRQLSYNIQGKAIFITRSITQAELNNKEFRVPVLMIPLFINIKGRVVDEEGNPVAGATVQVKGDKAKGTATNVDGDFRLNGLDENTVLVVSGVNIETREIKISGKENLGDIVVKMKVGKGEEVIVVNTGVSARNKNTYTGAASIYSGDQLRKMGNQNLFQSLKNMDPTVNIMENIELGSDPNAMPNINMRGGTSFDESMGDPNLKGNYQNKPNQPLFILDGFEASVERIFDLDMNIVESISILRDGSAKALYGSRAANGVVVIETRALKASKPRITYAGSLDITMPDLSSYSMLDAEKKLAVEYREGVYPDTDPAAFTNYNNLRKQVLEGLNTYWLSKPVHMGYGSKHSVNIDLGKDELRAQVNLSKFDNVGVMKGSDRETLNGGLNLLYRINKFRFQNRLALISNKADDSPYGSFRTYTLLNPYLNPYDEYGNLLPMMANNTRNPLNDGIIPTSLNSKYVEVTNNFEAQYDVMRGMNVRVRLSTTIKKNNADRYYPATHSKFANYPDSMAFRKGAYEANYGNNNRVSGDVYLNYNKVINNNHNIFFTGGFNMAENKFREEIHYAEGFPSANMNDIMFAYQYNAIVKRPSGVVGINREVGLLTMMSYTYMDRFLFDGTFRVNGSSSFGSQNRLAPFWSLGLGWNLHKEAAFRGIKAINELKLRGSVGSTGNQNFLNNKSITVNNYYLDDRYAGLIGSYALNMENPGLKWEQKMDYNIGVDADIYKINIKFDLYRSITQNLVTQASTAPSTGFVNVSENLGKVENKGVELAVSYTVFQNRAGFFRVNGSYVYNKNTILKISDAMRSFNEKQLATINDRTGIANKTAPTIMFYDGLPMNTIWAVPSYGIDPATGIELLRGKDGMSTYIWKASDMVPSGISVPKWRGTFGLNGEYKGVGLIIACTYLGGGQYYNSTLLNKVENISITSNFDSRVLTDRWSTPGQEAQFKRLTGRTPYDMRNGIYWYSTTGWNQEATRPTQRFVQNQNELNISSIALSYTFNPRWISKARMERLRMDVYMNDVVKFSTIGMERGTTYPFARTVSFKLTATF